MDLTVILIILDISPPWPCHHQHRLGLNVDLNDIESATNHLSVLENYAFDTNIGRVDYVYLLK